MPTYAKATKAKATVGEAQAIAVGVAQRVLRIARLALRLAGLAFFVSLVAFGIALWSVLR